MSVSFVEGLVSSQGIPFRHGLAWLSMKASATQSRHHHDQHSGLGLRVRRAYVTTNKRTCTCAAGAFSFFAACIVLGVPVG